MDNSNVGMDDAEYLRLYNTVRNLQLENERLKREKDLESGLPESVRKIHYVRNKRKLEENHINSGFEEEKIPLLHNDDWLLNNPENNNSLGKRCMNHCFSVLCGSSPADQEFITKRKLLLKRVYLTLTTQILFTAIGVASLVIFPKLLTEILRIAMPLLIGSTIMSVCFILLLYCGFAKSSPLNIILLVLFTISTIINVMIGCGSLLCQSRLGGSCTIDYNAGLMILQAFSITIVVLVSLTIFEFQHRINFDWLGGVLLVGLMILCFWGIFILIFGLHMPMIYNLMGVLIFFFYILYDTWLLVDRFDPEEWVLATINLYLDVINFFLYLLSLIANYSSSLIKNKD